VDDYLVVHLEDADGAPGELYLFVQSRDAIQLSDRERSALREEIRRALSPRHMPDRIVDVAAAPRTLSGKRLEVPVKRILMGDVEVAASTGSLVDPTALDEYVECARLRERR
jgi:acetoacetyl-CoA synthetase